MHPFLFNISYTLGFFFTFLSSTLYKDNMLMMLWWLTFFFAFIGTGQWFSLFYWLCCLFQPNWSLCPPGTADQGRGLLYSNTRGHCHLGWRMRIRGKFFKCLYQLPINLNHICFIYFCVSHVSLAWAKFKIGIHDKE